MLVAMRDIVREGFRIYAEIKMKRYYKKNMTHKEVIDVLKIYAPHKVQEFREANRNRKSMNFMPEEAFEVLSRVIQGTEAMKPENATDRMLKAQIAFEWAKWSGVNKGYRWVRLYEVLDMLSSKYQQLPSDYAIWGVRGDTKLKDVPQEVIAQISKIVGD